MGTNTQTRTVLVYPLRMFRDAQTAVVGVRVLPWVGTGLLPRHLDVLVPSQPEAGGDRRWRWFQRRTLELTAHYICEYEPRML